MNRSVVRLSCVAVLIATGASASAAGFPRAPVIRCAADAVLAGTVCLDKCEASVWRLPNPTTTNASPLRKIELGR